MPPIAALRAASISQSVGVLKSPNFDATNIKCLTVHQILYQKIKRNKHVYDNHRSRYGNFMSVNCNYFLTH